MSRPITAALPGHSISRIRMKTFEAINYLRQPVDECSGLNTAIRERRREGPLSVQVSQPGALERIWLRACDRIFGQAHMSFTGFVGDCPEMSIVAPPRYLWPRRSDRSSWPKGAGDVCSNIADMHAWNTALMGGQVIGSESLRLMFAPVAAVPPPGGKYYGMGFFVLQNNFLEQYMHPGSIAGYSAFNGIVRHKQSGAFVSVTLLANSDHVGLEQLAGAIVALALQ